MTKEVLAIIPARGGSKGIKRKNVVDFKGKPLIVHSINHALESKLVTRVVVSTDDEEIAKVAIAAGAEVPFLRPAELAEDHVLDLPVFEHCLNWLEKEEYYRAETIVHLRPTAPYRKSIWIDECIQLLESNLEADAVRSVSEPNQHPYRVFTIEKNGYLQPIMLHEHPNPALLRRQDLPKMYFYNCVIDVTRRDTILAKKSMVGDKLLPYVLKPEEVIDIDSERDLEIARSIFDK